MLNLPGEIRPSVRGRTSNILYGALVCAVGLSSAEAIDFYVDSRLAALDPVRYEQSIKKLLGEHGGDLIVRAMRSELARLGQSRATH